MSAVIVITGHGQERSITANWSGLPAALFLEIRLFWYVRNRAKALPLSAPSWFWKASPRPYILFQQTVSIHRILEPGPDGTATIDMDLPAEPISGPVARGHIYWAVELVALHSYIYQFSRPELLGRQPIDGPQESAKPQNG
jgi:hypothetical protein